MRTPRKNRPHGSIVAVGGGEEKFDKPDILERFVAEAGGADARIAILPTASAIPAERALFYQDVFRKIGAGEAFPLPIVTRDDAHLPANLGRPMCAIADRLGQAPLLPYSGYVLDNWYRLDKSGPITLDNIVMHQNFLGGADEIGDDSLPEGEGRIRGRSAGHRGIPSWDEAIGMIVEANMLTRTQRRPSGNGSPRGRGRGGRRRRKPS